MASSLLAQLNNYAASVRHFLLHPDLEVREIAHQYAQGAFLMDNGQGLSWYQTAGLRAILPLSQPEGLHIPRRLRREFARFEVRINQDFAAVVAGCRGKLDGAPARSGEWINDELAALYTYLHHHRLTHSFEVWQDGQLAGGVLGIVLGGAFIAESKFHRVSNASKVALIELAGYLHKQGFVMLDAQIQNEHIQSLGVIEIPQKEYQTLLDQSLKSEALFLPDQFFTNG